MAAYDQQAVWWLSRLKPKTTVYVAGHPLCSLATWLARQRTHHVDVAVALGGRRRLACRLVAVRLPPAVARQRQERVRKKAAKKGRPASAEQLALAGWNRFVTNLPAALANTEVVVLARCRGQVELLFKLWKSHGQVDASRSRKPARVLWEVYAKLLALVVQHWVVLGWAGAHADRSLYRAARAVRPQAQRLLYALREVAVLAVVLGEIVASLGRRCRVTKRRGQPATFPWLQPPPSGSRPQAAAAEAHGAKNQRKPGPEPVKLMPMGRPTGRRSVANLPRQKTPDPTRAADRPVPSAADRDARAHRPLVVFLAVDRVEAVVHARGHVCVLGRRDGDLQLTKTAACIGVEVRRDLA